MNLKVKAPILILIVLIIISLAIAVWGFYLFQKEKAKSLRLQDKLEEITVDLRRTESSLDEYKKKSSGLESQLKSAEGNIEKLKSELEEEKAAREQTEAKMELLRQDLEQQKELRSDLEKRLSQTQEEAKKTQAQIRGLEAKKQELEAKLSDLGKQSQGVELGEIVVSPETSKPLEVTEKPAEALVKKEKITAIEGREGKVLAVNKDYNFVVINLGSKDDIGLDDLFSIYHNNKYVGDIKVEKVHEAMAAAGFVSSDMKNKVFEGDKVVQKVK
jgi:predicted RNase H-like nuclease (RuvC/YqgF family)